MPISNKPWGQFSESDYTPEQWVRACLIHLADDLVKANHKLPVREPGGALNKNALAAAAAVLAGARGGVDAPSSERQKAARKLIRLYHEAEMEPPESLKRLAGY